MTNLHLFRMYILHIYQLQLKLFCSFAIIKIICFYFKTCGAFMRPWVFHFVGNRSRGWGIGMLSCCRAGGTSSYIHDLSFSVV